MTHIDGTTLSLTKHDKDKNPIESYTIETSPLNKPVMAIRGKPSFPDNMLEGVERYDTGQLLVHPNLELKTHPNIFAIGDIAACFDSDSKDYVPSSGQVTTQQAKYMAKLLIEKAESGSKKKATKVQGVSSGFRFFRWNRNQPFKFNPIGHILYMGPNDTLVTFKIFPKLIITGKLGTFIRNWYYGTLFKTTNKRKKLVVSLVSYEFLVLHYIYPIVGIGKQYICSNFKDQ